MSLDEEKNISQEKDNQAKAQQTINADKQKGIDLDKVASDLAARLTGEARSYTVQLKEILGVKTRLNEDDQALLSLSKKLTNSAQENNNILRRSGRLNSKLLEDRKTLAEIEREINILLATNRESSDKILEEATKLQNVQKKLLQIDKEIAKIERDKKEGYTSQLQIKKNEQAIFEQELLSLDNTASLEAKKLAVILATKDAQGDLIKLRQEELKFGYEVNRNLGITGALLDNLDKIGVRILGGIGLNFGVFKEAIEEGKEEMYKLAEAYTLLDKTQLELIDPKNIERTEELKDRLSQLGLQIAQTLDTATQQKYNDLIEKRTKLENEYSKKLAATEESQSIQKTLSAYNDLMLKKGELSKLEDKKRKKKSDIEDIKKLEKEISSLEVKLPQDFTEEAYKNLRNKVPKLLKEINRINKDFPTLDDDLKNINLEVQEFGVGIANANSGLSGMRIKFRAMRQALPGIKKAFTEALFDPLTPALIGLKLAGGLINLMKENFASLDKATVEFRRLTGQNASVLAGMNSRLATSVQTLGIMAALTKDIGTDASAIFGPQELGALAEAQNLLGLSAEQTSMLGLMAKSTGKSIDGFQDSFSAATAQANALGDSAIPVGLVFGDILTVSKDISLSLGNNPQALAKAGVAARALGLDLKKIDQIASSLLDFDSSIEAELEAQLLTGKAINLAKAREFALNNDLAGVANELAKNGASAAEFARMNRIQQESISKALGMSREELANSIIAQDLQNELTAEQRAQIRGVTLEQSKQMEVQEEIRMSLQKLAQAFLPIVQAVTPLITALTPLVTYLAEAVAYGLNMANIFSDAREKTTELTGAVKALGITLLGIGGILTIVKIAGWVGSAYTGVRKLTAIVTAARGPLKALGASISNAFTRAGTAAATASGTTAATTVATAGTAAATAGATAPQMTAASTASKATTITARAAKTAQTVPPTAGTGVRKFLTDLSRGLITMGLPGVPVGTAALSASTPAIRSAALSSKTVNPAAGVGVRKFLTDLSKGLMAMNLPGVLKGALTLIPTSLGLVAMLPGVLGAKALQTLNGPGITKALTGLSSGLVAMNLPGVLKGVGVLAVAGGAFTLLTLGIPSMRFIGTFGSAVGTGLASLGTGITTLIGAGLGAKVLAGAAGAFFLLTAGIPAMAAIALLGLRVGTGLASLGTGLTALGTAGPAAVKGMLILGGIGLALAPLTYALSLLAPLVKEVFTGFNNLLEGLTMDKLVGLYALGPALMVAAAGLTAFGAAMTFGGLGAGITNLLTGGGLLGQLGTLAEMAQPLAGVGASLMAISAGLQAVADATEKIEVEKIKELDGLITTTAQAAPFMVATKAIGDIIGNIAGKQEPTPAPSNDRIINKLDELIGIVKKGGNVYMDSNKVGQAIVLAGTKTS